MVPTDGVPGGWAGESEHLDPSNPREQGLMLDINVSQHPHFIRAGAEAQGGCQDHHSKSGQG
jgi:hypothetical protein